MALTKISTDGVKDDAITKAKIPADQIEASELANNAVDTNAIADQAVTLDKLPHGDSNNNGKFLRANNGADPSFEDVPAGGISDVVSDTSPQLGGDLQSNGNDILIAANDRAVFGTDKLRVKHTDSNADIENTTGNIVIKNDSSSTTEQIILQAKGGEDSIKAVADGAVELYYDNEKVLETAASKVNIKQRLQVHNDGPASGHGMAIGQWDGSNHRIEGDANRPMVITSYNSGGIKMGVSGANKVAVNSHGIVFNGDTAAANALDDYEEGTFTPSLTAGFAYATTITYQNQTGHYTKIGNQVFAYIYLQPNGNSAHSGNLITDGNSLTVGGLPFTCSNTANHEGGGYVTYINGSFGTGGVELQAMPWVPGNASYVIFHTPEDGNNLNGNETNLTNKYLIFHVRYHV